MPRVPRVPECVSAWVPFEWPSAKVTECLSAQVPWVPECPSAQVPFDWPGASSTQVPWVLECSKGPSALSAGVLRCPSSALSTRVPKCPLNALNARVPECLECLKCLKCPSASVSQLVSHPVRQLVYNAGSVS